MVINIDDIIYIKETMDRANALKTALQGLPIEDNERQILIDKIVFKQDVPYIPYVQTRMKYGLK